MRFSDGGQFIIDERADVLRLLKGIVDSGLAVRVTGHHFRKAIMGGIVSVEGAHHRFMPNATDEVPPVPVLTSATLTVNLNAGQVQWNAPVISCHGGSLSLGIPERVVTGQCRASYRVTPNGPHACPAHVEQSGRMYEGHVLDVSFEGVGVRLHDVPATEIETSRPVLAHVSFQDYSCTVSTAVRWSAGGTLGLQLIDGQGEALTQYPEPWLDFVRRVAYSAVMSQLGHVA